MKKSDELISLKPFAYVQFEKNRLGSQNAYIDPRAQRVVIKTKQIGE